MRFILATALVFGGCSAFTSGWNDTWIENLPEPDLIVEVTDSISGDLVIGATFMADHGPMLVRHIGLAYGLCWEVPNVVHLSVSHPEYVRRDTTILMPRDQVTSIGVALTSNVIATGKPDHDIGPYRDGWDDAERMLTEKNACIVRSGGLTLDMIRVDTRTGLPLRGNFTCIVNDTMDKYAEGYNDRIYLDIARNGLPDNSKKAWLSLIQNPKKYFKTNSKSIGVVVVTKDGAAAYSPDTSCSISLESSPDLSSDHGEVRVVVLNTKTECSNGVWGRKTLKQIELVWGPSGSQLVVIHTSEGYFVFDILHCEMLNLEYD